jgi:alpha-1,2-rhamnosyltransferase
VAIPPQKIFVECTYTHFSDLNTGIQRVVRKLIALLPDIGEAYGYEVQPVILENDRFRAIDTLNPVEHNQNRSVRQLFVGIFRKISLSVRKGIAFLLPHPQIKRFLLAPRNEFGINFLVDQYVLQNIKKCKALFEATPQVPPAQWSLDPHEGDILLLLDSSWHMGIWDAVGDLRKKGVQVIALTYDLIPILYPQFVDDALVTVFSKWFEQASFQCEGFISISRTVQTEVEDALARNPEVDLSSKFTGHFILGADFLAKGSDPAKIRKALPAMFLGKSSFPKTGNIYLTVGTIEPRKNHQYLLDAFDSLWAKGGEMILCCVGKCGWKNDDVLLRIRKHKLYGKNLFLWNDLNDDELGFCYQNAQMLLFASHAEGFGLPIIEGLDFGLPVMASDIPVHREVGKDNIKYFDLSDSDDLVTKIEFQEKEGFASLDNSTPFFQWISWTQSGHSLMKEIVTFDQRLRHSPK